MTGPVPGRKPLLALLMRLLWAAALVPPAFGASAGVVLTSLHSFQVFNNGAQPSAGLVQGSDGNFYGTTSGGGTNGDYGTVLKISTHGALTTLYSFTGSNDGAYPRAALVQGNDGNLYGTTYSGGTNNQGTVFKISTKGALTSLYSFSGTHDGSNPNGLVQGNDGNFCGTTYSGGTNNQGTVFKIGTSGALTSLYSFTGTNDGANPNDGLVQGSDGNFYGTTKYGGTTDYNADFAAYGRGTVFMISTAGVLTSLYSFTGGKDGAYPSARLVQASDGNLYGTTSFGGTYPGLHGVGYGTVFKISTKGAYISLYSFPAGNHGVFPSSGLVQGNDGSLYGTTPFGGGSNDFGGEGYGTVFKISTDGALISLYSFTGTNDGAYPNGLVQGNDGDFYGTTASSGPYGYVFGGSVFGSFGTVFKISTSGVLTSLYAFTRNDQDGANPSAGLVQGSDGNFYGTTSIGGTNGGNGTVFKISVNGVLTSLYSFTGNNDGGNPKARLVQASDGTLYGTTYSGGTNNQGTVFKISTNASLTSLYSFTGTNDGANPNGLVQGTDGSFYGTASGGGTNFDPVNYPSGAGTVFRISTNGALTTLHSFTGGNDGGGPRAGLVQGTDGNLYGTTESSRNGAGTEFIISTNGALTTLHSFTGGNDGGSPEAALVQGSDGNLYGTTSAGGMDNAGTVFKISTNGALRALYLFTGGRGTPDGANPKAGLVQGRDGNFYGTTSGGGTNNAGTVFTIGTNGAETSLYSFNAGNDGWDPQADLVQGSDGNFYGTAYLGGSFYGLIYADQLSGAGNVFRLTIVPAAPVIQALALTNGALRLTWSTEVGGTYQPQFSSDLNLSNWTNLGGALTAAGATLSATDSVTNGPRRFYRVVLLP